MIIAESGARARAAEAAVKAAPEESSGRGVLAVFDLDGTLTYRDTLLPFLVHVLGWRGFLAGALRALPALARLAVGRVPRDAAKAEVLRAFLGARYRAELRLCGEAFARERLARLMRPQALERLAWHQASGHRCALATASLDVYVEPWARAAGFDEVFATRLEYDRAGRFTGRLDGGNCRGAEKLRRLEAHYGELTRLPAFGYGDSPADRSFLERCRDAAYKPFTVRSRPRDLLRLMRPHQWSKNAFVLVGLIFGHAWAEPALVASALLAAVAFCFASSAVYIVNDLADRNRDRLHPQKRHRPLAAGVVNPGTAGALAVLLAAAAAALGGAAGGAVALLIALYAAINLAYSYVLKHVVILDVFVISAGFVLRILAGTLAIGIPPSKWLLVCSLMLTLFLGFAKRRSELAAVAGEAAGHRKSLQEYNPALLDKMISICAAAAILSYSLYTMSPEVAALHGTPYLIYTIPFVVYGIFRYLHLLHARQGGGDTAHELVRDPHLVAAVGGWAAASFLLIAGAA
ncbi:MAG TPA: decaprenyl-phosphate phosphoribosyltransferase [Burkholderiales bacterium]|nr:decaprenyl-phosphate phosphoribosyltransferase [Burkholderiales bacterium]